MKSALLLIDIQNDYFTGGKNELFQPEEAAAVAAKALEKCRAEGDEVIYIQHIGQKKNGTFFREGTEGCEIHASVKPLENEKIFVKHKPNSFYETGLDEYLKNLGITELLICGMMSHMCIDTTVRAAKELGYSIKLIDNACTTKDLSYNGEIYPAKMVHKVFMAAIDGKFADVISL